MINSKLIKESFCSRCFLFGVQRKRPIQMVARYHLGAIGRQSGVVLGQVLVGHLEHLVGKHTDLLDAVVAVPDQHVGT